MDTILDAQLERMETALGTLLSSIITYNPSVSAADELLLADDELSKGLEQLTRHQSNYTRILQLRHEAELLDSKIKTSVQLLADIRKDLLAIPLDAPREPVKPVPYKTLLTYAKNISPFTIPPTFRPKPLAATGEGDKKNEDEVAQDGTRTGDDSAIANTPAGEGTEQPPVEDTATQKALTDEQKAWLTQLNDLPFQPWPGEEQMAAGALHALHRQVVNGNDPTDLAAVIEEEKFMAEQKQKQEEDEARRKRYADSRAAGVSQARPKEEVQRQAARFGLDDDSDDDDD